MYVCVCRESGVMSISKTCHNSYFFVSLLGGGGGDGGSALLCRICVGMFDWDFVVSIMSVLHCTNDSVHCVNI